MKNVNKKIGTFVMAIAMVSLFGSCSKQTTSIGHYNKLDNAQTLGNEKPLPAQKESIILAQVNTPVQATETNHIILTKGGNIEPIEIHAKKTTRQLFVQTLTKKTEKSIIKHTAFINHLTMNHSIASTSATKDGGGLLGLAVTLLIIGIVLFFLGFGSLGALFWTIGIVLLVIALIFFILWMVGRAVSN